MSAPHNRHPSLFASTLAALVLVAVGQAFQPALPLTSAAPPATESKKDAPLTTKPVQDDPSPASSGGTLIKRKKTTDPAPSKTAPSEEIPPTKIPAGKPAPKEDTPLKPESSPPKPAGKSEKTSDKPEKPTTPEDEALLKSLGTTKDDTEADDVERLERAISGMRQAQQRIEERDSGKNTQEIQTRVVKDLASLIDALQNPKSPPQDQNQDPQDQNQQNQKNKKQQSGKKQRKLNLLSRRQMAQMRQQQQEHKRQQEQARRNQEDQTPEKSKDTSASQAPTKAPAADKDRQQDLVKDVWGHLPPNVRAELLNVFSEKYLPKYEDLVRRYYEALAEKNRGRASGR